MHFPVRARASGNGPDYGAALWTMAAVIEQLEEAAATVRRMPGRGGRPGGHRVAWPDIVREVSEAYGYDAAAVGRLAPAPGAIDRADAALHWLLWLDAEQRRLVWARAVGISWRRLEPRLRLCERQLRRRYRAAILCIVARLAQNPVAMSGHSP